MRYVAERGFCIANRAVVSDILIPRYYDPRITEALAVLSETHELIAIEDLTKQGHLKHEHGNYVPKINYGTGPYPYIRTSDISNWELNASPKHGVNRGVFEEYSERQNVKPLDIIFVHEGTYLIGRCAMVSPYDGPCLYQHHLAKFRVQPGAPFSPFFLLAAFGSSIVRRQIRARQFSADIIDSVVGRLGEVVIPVPRSQQRRDDISAVVERCVIGRARDRERLAYFFAAVEELLAGHSSDFGEIVRWTPSDEVYKGRPAFLGQRDKFQAFGYFGKDIKNDILLPRYYDPTFSKVASLLADKCDLVAVETLERDGVLAARTGEEVGKINYGTGTIPFVRTSDLGSYELKMEAKQGVSKEVYQRLREQQDVQPDDILLVRDGTYLVGASAMIFEADLPLLYCGGILRFRVKDTKRLPAGLLYCLLNLPFVRRQIRSKKFTRDVIDTLGQRYRELLLPIPRDPSLGKAISDHVEAICRDRVALRAQLAAFVEQLYRT